MRLNIVFRHLAIDRELEQEIYEQACYLERRFFYLLSVRIIIDRDYADNKQCHLLLRGRGNLFINVKCTRPSEFISVMDAFEEAERKLFQLEKKRRNQQHQLNNRDRILLTTRKAWAGGW